MSAKGSRKIKVGDMVKFNRFGESKSFIGIVVNRIGTLCHVKWFDEANIDYIYCSDLEKLS